MIFYLFQLLVHLRREKKENLVLVSLENPEFQVLLENPAK